MVQVKAAIMMMTSQGFIYRFSEAVLTRKNNRIRRLLFTFIARLMGVVIVTGEKEEVG